MNIDLTIEETRQPVPNFTVSTAMEKVRKAENAWNSKNPELVACAYTINSQWRNRNTFITGRQAIVSFLKNKWQRESHYKLIKELWATNENRIAVRFAYEWQHQSGQWFRSYGNENWQFDNNGLMAQRFASINDVEITKQERKFLWDGDQRPNDYPSLSYFNL